MLRKSENVEIKKMRVFWIFGAAVALTMVSRPAFAYIDPGLITTLSQALFAFLFGAAAIWIMRPWRFLKSLFRKSSNEDDKEGAAPSKPRDSSLDQ